MSERRRIGREVILEEAARIVSEGGTQGLTFQALASRLGVTKQAVIYWFPTKQELARELAVPAVRAEADAAVDALAGAIDAAESIARFVRALVRHHLADLGRFRLMHFATQFDRRAGAFMGQEQVMEPVHRESARMYGALEAAIAADPDFLAGRNPRRLAVAVHMATIGLLTMVALADSVRDPLAHDTAALVDSLVSLLTGER